MVVTHYIKFGNGKGGGHYKIGKRGILARDDVIRGCLMGGGWRRPRL